MADSELVLHLGEEPIEQGFGQRRELLPCPQRTDRARQQTSRNQEFLLLPDDAGTIDQILIGARVGQKGIDLGNQHVAVGDVIGEGRVDQSVHDVGAVDNRFGHAWCRCHELNQERAELRMITQQRKELYAGRQAREEIVEMGQRLIGIAGATKGQQ